MRIGEVKARNGRGRMHSKRLCQLNTSLLFDLHQIPHGRLLGVIRLSRISSCWSNTLIFNGMTLSYGQLFIRAVTPNFFSDLAMNLFSECLSKSIGESFNQHVIVIITLLNILLAELLLFETSRYGKASNIIGLS